MKKSAITKLAIAIVGCWAALVSPTVGGAEPETPPGTSRGPTAVDVLGDRMGPLAREMAVSEADLRSTLLRDQTLGVDRDGNLRVTDPPVSATSERAGSWPSKPPFATDRTFTLHSRSTSTKKIYLDFTGHTMTGTLWNSALGQSSIGLGAYDLDGSPGTYSPAEHAVIQNTFLSVREDFSSFDVDVTTQNPGAAALRKSGSSDAAYGIRVVVTPTDFESCGCGGAAYVGSFDRSDLTPAYVLNRSAKGVAEAVSHEVGHTLGLLHDGLTTADAACAADSAACTYYRGHGDWAPIMGSSYSRSVTQWSKGEYRNANNKQDDLAVMQANGLPDRVPDHGGTIATAYPLAIGTTIRGEPINWTGDVDAWRVGSSTTRALSINVENWYGHAVDTDLNVRIRLYSPSGTLLATASPTTTTGATLSTSITPGTYYVFVDGVGDRSPATTGYSSYASIGRYNMTIR